MIRIKKQQPPRGSMITGQGAAAYPHKFQKTKRVLTAGIKGICRKWKLRNVGNKGVNTMAETKTLGIRLKAEDKERLSRYLTRESAESLLRQIDKGEVELTPEGAVFKGVNTTSEGVNSTIERISENSNSENTVIEGVNTDCDNCPYMENSLNMSAFDEVCEFKGIDRQKALDKCVQMLWR